ncbi:MAG: DUF6597 domain-containing transcriptional factor [Gammaproteobacteria bacterium]
MIGKTRHLDDSAKSRLAFGQGCGVLRHSPFPGTYRHVRYAPSGNLAHWVQHFWIESWDLLGDASQTREVLPHPCVHLAFVRGRSRIFGVQQQRFLRELKGKDCVVGVKFRPGAFYPFLQKPVSSITDTSFPAEQLFADAKETEVEVSCCTGDQEMVALASRFLRAHLPPPDPVVEQACSAVETIANDPDITRVEHVIERCGIQDRALQRMFRRYIGASPRWIIKRYRVYEALAHLGDETRAGWASLAQDLGYYDQAHFINDFRRLVGRSPTEYINT